MGVYIDETEVEAEHASESPLLAIDRLVEHFAIPLEGAEVILTNEFEAMLHNSFPYQLLTTNLYGARLLFSLPASVKCTFSQLNLLKTSKHASLGNEILKPEPAINLWWEDKLRRPNQVTRKDDIIMIITCPTNSL